MRKVLACLLLLFTVVLASAFAQSHSLLLTPYLQGVTTSSIYVLVESASADTLAVEYGTTSSYGSRARTESTEQTSERTFVHNVKLRGLSPNTVYHYRAILADTASEDASFRTAPNPGTSFRFAWMADVRSTRYPGFWNAPIPGTSYYFGWITNRRWGPDIHDVIAKRIRDANPVMSLYGGDLCFDTSYAAFKREFFRPNERSLIAHVPFFNTPGNHEKWSQNTKAFTHAPESPSVRQEYYSFDYGDMHVLVLNNEVDYSEEVRSISTLNMISRPHQSPGRSSSITDRPIAQADMAKTRR